MDADLKSVGMTEPAPDRGAFADLQMVRLKADLQVEEGVFPSGSVGAVVHSYPGAATYEVEFLQPHQAVITLRADQIAAV